MTSRVIRKAAALLAAGTAVVGAGAVAYATHSASPEASRCTVGAAVNSANVVGLPALSKLTNDPHGVASTGCDQPRLMAGARICVPTQAISNPLPRQICVLPNPWLPA